MRNLDWDYTDLADDYVHRPDYAPEALERAITATGLGPGTEVADMGAGAAHLTRELARRGFAVTAVEPNPRMREHGIERTGTFDNVRWVDAVMEQTELPESSFSLLTFGSSFGVAEKQATLREAHRVLRPGGFVLCVFNHRDLDDPLQAEIERAIVAALPGYDYGPRRHDQGQVIEASGLFQDIRAFEAKIAFPVTPDWVRAWRSHATLKRQAGDRFDAIVERIAAIVGPRADGRTTVPYTTRAWLARRIGGS